MKIKFINIGLPEDLYKEFKQECAYSKESLASCMRNLIRIFLQERKIARLNNQLKRKILRSKKGG